MHAKKSLGQNFLKSEPALRKIVEAGEIEKSDIILEIGPGRGALTTKLLEKAKTVVAVEKDGELFEFLKKKFEKEIVGGKLNLLNKDILDFDFGEENYKVIANIPYNITGAILKKFLTAKNQPASMVLMVQNEVAKRIVARDGKESILSISVKAYGQPKMIMKVPARYFSPAPKVDSAIIAIKEISRKFFKENGINERHFWEIVRAGFAHKRKKLSSNLKSIKNYNKNGNGIELENKRAEELTISDWIPLLK
jgi:16S rRNA (adenine1518-N6/adenine1519-N6)-dimethyltransferase